MFPTQPISNSIHGVSVKPERYGNSTWAFPILHALTRFQNLIRGQFTGVNLLALSLFTLSRKVGHVVFSSAKEQVIRIYTLFHVALVAHKKAFRNWSVVQFPRKAVGQMANFWNAHIVRKLSIPVWLFTANPQPARVCLFDVSPKPGFQWFDLLNTAQLVLARFRATGLFGFVRLEIPPAHGTFELRHSRSLLSMFQGLTGLIPGASRSFNLTPTLTQGN